MVFDNYYDRALWLMLQGNKKNKELIVELINNLTCEMYECIYNLIEQYGEDSSLTSIHSELSGDDFKFLVQIKGTILTIILNKFDSDSDKKIGDRYELSLLPIVDYFMVNRKMNNVTIGSFSYKKSKLQNEKMGYLQMETISDVSYVVDHNILTTVDSHTHDIISFKKVDMSQIPEKIYPQCIKCKIGKKGRIRKK